jgi:transcriptional regulator with XRE-family HTH domain
MISLELMKFLKNRATSQGVTQKVIADYFDVSIPTVKRWYSGAGLSLEQANELSNYLGISLGQDLISIQNNTKSFHYTHIQETFFAKNPDYLAFFDNLLRGKTVKYITKKFSLSDTKVSKYLLKLDKLKLLELHSNNKIKLLTAGEPVWAIDGPLKKSLKKNIIDDYLSTKNSVIDKFYLYELSKDDLELILKMIEELTLLNSRSNNRAIASDKISKPYGFSISLKEFHWSLDKFF